MDGHKLVAWQQRIPPTVQQKSWWECFSQCARCGNMQEPAFAMACHAHFHSGNTTVCVERQGKTSFAVWGPTFMR